ncbi:MAG: SpoIIE family protein phosphatase [Treponema sp.]|nr:SpoIIE family protein phosphatase [Treponema sp.]
MAKTLRVFLLVCFVSLAVSGVIAMVSILNVRSLTLESSHNIGSAAADSSRESLQDQVLRDTTELVTANSNLIDFQLREAQDMVLLLKGYIERIYRSKEEFRLVKIPSYRQVPPGETGIHWFTEPGRIPNPQYVEDDLIRSGLLEETYLLGNLERVSQLVMKIMPTISTIYLTTESGQNIQYDGDAALKAASPYAPPELRSRLWYKAARDRNGVYISGAYHDAAGRGLSISITTPFSNKEGEFTGVVGIDIKIEDLDESIRRTVVARSGYAVLLNNGAGEDGKESGIVEIVSAPGFNGQNTNNVVPFLGSNTDSILAEMKSRPSGSSRSTLYSEGRMTDVYVIWAPVNLPNWQLAYILPEEDIQAPAAALYNEITGMTALTVKRVDSLVFTAIWIFVSLMIFIFLLTVWLARLIAGRIAQPIIALTSSVKKIGNGNLDYRSEIKTGDEIEELSLGFERMTGELKGYIENLRQVTAEKERIGAELDVARRIQESMLPRIFPPFPDRQEFDLYGFMLPAKEVGGDFYDFFLIDQDTLAVMIADVSGKGVPAALFMVIAKTLIQNNAQNGLSPKEVFERVNNLLYKDNEESMFVTAFMGYLDIPSGKFTCVNAGHNPPLIKRGDKFEWLKIKRGFVLGGVEDMVYREEETTFNPGDMLYLYTDGVTEAMNTERQLFTEARLLQAAAAKSDWDLREFAVSIKKEIDAFAGGAEQADDITMLALQYCGAGKWKELKIEALSENLDRVMDFVNVELEKIDCPPKTQRQIDIAIEEVFVNIAQYAYNPGTGFVVIRIRTGFSEIRLEFEDQGEPYNPLKTADPDISLSAEDRPIGGLGVFMVKKIMDTVEYRCEGSKNLLTLTKMVR